MRHGKGSCLISQVEEWFLVQEAVSVWEQDFSKGRKSAVLSWGTTGLEGTPAVISWEAGSAGCSEAYSVTALQCIYKAIEHSGRSTEASSIGSAGNQAGLQLPLSRDRAMLLAFKKGLYTVVGDSPPLVGASPQALWDRSNVYLRDQDMALAQHCLGSIQSNMIICDHLGAEFTVSSGTTRRISVARCQGLLFRPPAFRINTLSASAFFPGEKQHAHPALTLLPRPFWTAL